MATWTDVKVPTGAGWGTAAWGSTPWGAGSGGVTSSWTIVSKETTIWT